MTEPVFFEIPIYRCSRSIHTKYMESEEQKIAPIENKERFPQSYQAAYNAFHSGKWYAWQYNEIVGYLNLYIMGTQIRGDTWFVTKKRINAGLIKKKFHYEGKAFEKLLSKGMSSSEIFRFMLETINELQGRDYKKFHLDLRAFKVIGQFVNWSELTIKLNSYTFPQHRKEYFESAE